MRWYDERADLTGSFHISGGRKLTEDWLRDPGRSPTASPTASYTQYDTDSDSVGINTRLRWTFKAVGDLFVVYNHNVRSLLERWQLDSNQLLVKLQYAWQL